ncbi:MAG TPA: hypothetical protein VFH58_07160 [Acidimicrobiales bacterium]|nr:hypothetical protein [Acidimicrobiales bacterium]
MTTTTNTETDVRSDLRRRAWVSAGAALLACSVALTWAVAGTWVVIGLLGLILGVGLAFSARHTSRPEASDTRHRPRAGSGTAPDTGASPVPTDLLVRGLRHDLPLVVGLCRILPSGALPQAGLLAEHTYVVADALRQVLSLDGERHPASLALDHAAVAAQLGEVDRRTGRLYSADRPGGLDHLDWHMTRLWVLSEEYFTEVDPGSSTRLAWPRSFSHRRRARILAWVATATGTPVAAVRSGQTLRTRAWLRSGIARRARRRARRLWGYDTKTTSAAKATPRPERVPARTGRGAA